eukprot:318114_1
MAKSGFIHSAKGFLGIDTNGYLTTGIKTKFEESSSTTLKVIDGKWAGYFLGGSGDHGYVMAYSSGSISKIQSGYLYVDGHKVGMQKDYLYASGRWGREDIIRNVKLQTGNDENDEDEKSSISRQINRQIGLINSDKGYLGIDEYGYLKVGIVTKYEVTLSTIKVVDGIYSGYFLGASGDHGYVMAYQTGNKSQFQFGYLFVDGHKVGIYKEYLYASGRWGRDNLINNVKLETGKKKTEKEEIVPGSIKFDLNNGKISGKSPQVIATITGENDSSMTQPGPVFKMSKTITETSTFTHTHGFEVKVGVKATCGVPGIASGEISSELSTQHSFQFGKTNTISKTYEINFPSQIPPRTKLVVQAVVWKSNLDVPYSMKVRKGNKEYDSSGIWRGVTTWDIHANYKETKLIL